MASANVQHVETLYAKFAERDIPAFVKGLASDIAWTVSDGFPYAGTYNGPQEVLDGVIGRVAGDWDGFRHELRRTIDCGDEVIVTGTYYGTWKETGRDMDAPFVHVWTIKDGLAQAFRQYVDVPGTVQATDGFEHRNA